MDAESVFANIVVLAIFTVIFVAVTGGNPDPLINILPSIVVVAFGIAVLIAIGNSI